MKLLKHSLAVVILCLIMMNGCSTPAAPAPEGPVATITRFNSNGMKTRLERYDREGNILEEVSFYNDGSVDNSTIYTYDDQGHLIEKFDSSTQDRYLYSYDDQGRLVLEVNEELSGRYETRSYFLEDGRLRIDSTDRHEYVSAYHMDENGNILEWMRINGRGDTLDRTESTYDAFGNNLEYTAWDNGQFFNRKRYTYDASGNAVDEQILDEAGNIEKRYVSTYDDDGRLVKIEQLGADGKSAFTITYTYKGSEKICKSAIPGMQTKTTKEVFTYYPE